jgi:hypothetical protein
VRYGRDSEPYIYPESPAKAARKMAPTLTSALTLSTLGHVSKAFLNFACKDVRVQGLDHLLKALQEPELSQTGNGDGAEKKEGSSVAGGRRTRRRGIVTGM